MKQCLVQPLKLAYIFITSCKHDSEIKIWKTTSCFSLYEYSLTITKIIKYFRKVENDENEIIEKQNKRLFVKTDKSR